MLSARFYISENSLGYYNYREEHLVDVFVNERETTADVRKFIECFQDEILYFFDTGNTNLRLNTILNIRLNHLIDKVLEWYRDNMYDLGGSSQFKESVIEWMIYCNSQARLHTFKDRFSCIFQYDDWLTTPFKSDHIRSNFRRIDTSSSSMYSYFRSINKESKNYFIKLVTSQEIYNKNYIVPNIEWLLNWTYMEIEDVFSILFSLMQVYYHVRTRSFNKQSLNLVNKLCINYEGCNNKVKPRKLYREILDFGLMFGWVNLSYWANRMLFKRYNEFIALSELVNEFKKSSSTTKSCAYFTKIHFDPKDQLSWAISEVENDIESYKRGLTVVLKRKWPLHLVQYILNFFV